MPCKSKTKSFNVTVKFIQHKDGTVTITKTQKEKINKIISIQKYKQRKKKESISFKKKYKQYKRRK